MSSDSNMVGMPQKNNDTFNRFLTKRPGDRFNCLTNCGKELRNLRVYNYISRAIIGKWTSEDGKRVWGVINADSLTQVERIKVGIEDIIGTES